MGKRIQRKQRKSAGNRDRVAENRRQKRPELVWDKVMQVVDHMGRVERMVIRGKWEIV